MRKRMKWLGGVVLAGVSLFQSGGCTAISNDQWLTLVNSGSQAFLNSMINQWANHRFDEFFGVV